MAGKYPHPPIVSKIATFGVKRDTPPTLIEDWPGEGLEEVVVHYDEVVVASSARPSVTEPSESDIYPTL